MADYIERETVINLLYYNVDKSCSSVVADIEALPAADVTLLVHGEINYRNRPEHYKSYKVTERSENGEPLYKREHHILEKNLVGYCSECGKRLCSRFKNYCPSCGAKMDGGAIDGEIETVSILRRQGCNGGK